MVPKAPMSDYLQYPLSEPHIERDETPLTLNPTVTSRSVNVYSPVIALNAKVHIITIPHTPAQSTYCRPRLVRESFAWGYLDTIGCFENGGDLVRTRETLSSRGRFRVAIIITVACAGSLRMLPFAALDTRNDQTNQLTDLPLANSPFYLSEETWYIHHSAHVYLRTIERV